jgi:hypothetical protein
VVELERESSNGVHGSIGGVEGDIEVVDLE